MPTILDLVNKYGSLDGVADAFLDRRLLSDEEQTLVAYGHTALWAVMQRRVFERLMVSVCSVRG